MTIKSTLIILPTLISLGVELPFAALPSLGVSGGQQGVFRTPHTPEHHVCMQFLLNN